MKLRILQINNPRNCSYFDRDYAFAKEHGFNLNDYQCVGEFSIDADNSLDDIFRMFNRVTEDDVERLNNLGYTGHSLSVSDIIDLEGYLYYCDSFGWTEINK